ncbi:hypothetical protein PPTG_21239 [Phytophthora nicotianae INRA-310]|uniref:Uncharacterized protein n=1 Tax=Phytophthora nicotianae (strain INRA-310) TaxID=761204 RepID=W2R4I4_PHYN3|nr:hypothetical protein PPTG_21239 [Phytophthora nicotianae INRA-310]ETN20176.1 hypothetical protein PPTG_21239 [Phytophthora nicotianae INRA-310]
MTISLGLSMAAVKYMQVQCTLANVAPRDGPQGIRQVLEMVPKACISLNCLMNVVNCKTASSAESRFGWLAELQADKFQDNRDRSSTSIRGSNPR